MTAVVIFAVNVIVLAAFYWLLVQLGVPNRSGFWVMAGVYLTLIIAALVAARKLQSPTHKALAWAALGFSPFVLAGLMLSS